MRGLSNFSKTTSPRQCHASVLPMRRRSFLATAGALLLGARRSDDPVKPSDVEAFHDIRIVRFERVLRITKTGATYQD
jgi:hypothetical protein